MTDPTGLRSHWALDPELTFLNHGSFGACPTAVLEAQSALRAEMERDPIRFFVHELEGRIEAARAAVAGFVGASPDDLGFVRNASAGVNAVLRSLRFEAGDELLITDQGYNACNNAARFVAERAGAKVVVAKIPFPLASSDEVVDAITAAVTDRTRLAIVDHVTSPTGLVLPIDAIVDELHRRGVDTLVDGAHAPGQLDLDVAAIGAAYYTANFHKWVCAPKGAAMLWVRPDRQDEIHPAVISHGWSSPRPRKRFLEEIDWQGTDDPTSYLCVPKAIAHVGSLVDGGWSAIRRKNRALALEARDLLAESLDVAPPAPDDMIGAMAALPLPDGAPRAPEGALYFDPLQRILLEEHRVAVPISVWPASPHRLVRVSAFLHNERGDYARLAEALTLALRRGTD